MHVKIYFEESPHKVLQMRYANRLTPYHDHAQYPELRHKEIRWNRGAGNVRSKQRMSEIQNRDIQSTQ